jgi:hypothetical protein
MASAVFARTAAILLVVAAVGSLRADDSAAEKQVRATFTAFADAVKAKDAAKIWKLLDKDSQSAANRAAKAVKAAYENANADDKAKLEKAVGLTGAELAKLTGEAFLKSKGFHGKYHDVPGSKIDKIVIQGKRATVHYTEEDGDKEKLRFLLEGEDWKVSAPMPPVPQL